MKNLAIVVVAFNRKESLSRLLNSLNRLNVPTEEEITLHISIDKAKEDNDKRNQEVVEYANEFQWKFGDKVVDYKRNNMGLRKHILECGNLTNRYENIIVLEDDIIVSPLMYMYAKQVINFYKNDENIAGFRFILFSKKSNKPFTILSSK